jgi:hypothetical protein
MTPAVIQHSAPVGPAFPAHPRRYSREYPVSLPCISEVDVISSLFYRAAEHFLCADSEPPDSRPLTICEEEYCYELGLS